MQIRIVDQKEVLVVRSESNMKYKYLKQPPNVKYFYLFLAKYNSKRLNLVEYV
jgi:hypothetical protein